MTAPGGRVGAKFSDLAVKVTTRSNAAAASAAAESVTSIRS